MHLCQCYDTIFLLAMLFRGDLGASGKVRSRSGCAGGTFPCVEARLTGAPSFKRLPTTSVVVGWEPPGLLEVYIHLHSATRRLPFSPNHQLSVLIWTRVIPALQNTILALRTPDFMKRWDSTCW